ncbi:hypothetical protein KVR01_005771 [Diaporthe batatas]|uniref:uncharacterized protein n=1 Tax=Diaporthe batatas TaxID=748121 RepID=UPI001D04B831|nr:uncharacterized protein KVR01_005771 [Diaporthe batatas]KAG8163853.1 hypothetical protein KVR01_005771 [Diaporthe batatas]
MSSVNGYGTAGPGATNGPARQRAGHNATDEEQPLLNGVGAAQSGSSKSLTSRLRKAAGAEVRRDWADVVLIFCYIITGMLDSSAISDWGSFVSMQTGNTVYIGLGLAAPTEGTRWIKSGTSLGFFCIGSFFFSRFHRHFGPKRRATLIASFTLQAALCIAAASIVTFGPGAGGSGRPDSKDAITWDVLVPIALVAFQACGQAVTSRALKYNALTSVVLTSIYCDLFSDAELFRAANPERNRRLGAPSMCLAGAVLGGLFAHSRFGIAGAMWTASAMKVFVVVVWLLWPAEAVEED